MPMGVALSLFLCFVKAQPAQISSQKKSYGDGDAAHGFSRRREPVDLQRGGKSIVYRVLGRKITYRLIARGEYDAARAYEHLIPAFPEVESIRADEQRHGDTVKALLARHVSVKKRIVRAIILTTGLLALAGCVYFTLSHRRHSRR